MSELVLTRQQDNLFFVTLNRVEKRNALTMEMTEEIGAAVEAAGEIPTVRAVIVEANGPIFSAGIDVMALAAMRAAAGDEHPGRWLRRMAERMQRALHRIENTELPVIGALNGRVIDLGLELALSFDLRVAAEDLQLSIPETRLGLVADVGGTTRLTRAIGASRAKDLLMTARSITAAEALHWGLVNRVVPGAELTDAAVALAREIAKNAPLAVGMAKLVIDQGAGSDKFTQMTMERWAQSQLIMTEDIGEAMAAFMEKRPAQFKGV